MAHSLQGVYSPLPQSLSDSDSEKELSMEPICTNYGNGLKSTQLETYGQNGNLGFSSVNDEIVKIKRVNQRMSTLRKVAFVFSILLCFLPIIIFLWILPCSDSNTCPVRISNWESKIENIELQGYINLVHGAFQSNLNLALMYRGSLINSPTIVTNGIISFMGSNGVVAWDFHENASFLVIEMNCSIIDVNGNGFNNCLVINEMGLKAIDTIEGIPLWSAKSDQRISIPELDMPVKVEDFDNDGINELLSIYKKESFILISGKTGLALSNINMSHICTTITNLTTNQTAIRYACKNPLKLVKTYEIDLVDIHRKYKNSKENLIPREVPNSNDIVYETGNRKLRIENQGKGPHRRSTISLYYSNNTKLEEWLYQNAYVMTPVPFSFQSTKANIVSLKGHIHGFVVKLWEWNAFSKKLPAASHIYRRSIPTHNKTYYLNNISERVILITFNETDTQIMNVSSVNISQICNGPDYESSCQPEHQYHQDSLLIADMDYDNSEELISYYSSYVKRDEDGNENWHLVSYLKVLRLENELPLLYSSK